MCTQCTTLYCDTLALRCTRHLSCYGIFSLHFDSLCAWSHQRMHIRASPAPYWPVLAPRSRSMPVQAARVASVSNEMITFFRPTLSFFLKVIWI